MASSLIFAGLVVLWLFVLVPIVARRRQVVPRPSAAALGGRVLRRRPATRRGRVEEWSEMDANAAGLVDADDRGAEDLGEQADEMAPPADEPAATTADERVADPVDEQEWDRPPPGYRRGRGGFDPEAAALAAQARYGFRQRVVLGLLLAALVSGIVAAMAMPVLWGLHVVIDVVLLGYLGYLRRQVRLEEEIRQRRAARLDAARRATAGIPADEAGLDPDVERGSADTEPEEPPAAAPEPALPPLPRAVLPARPSGATEVSDDEDPSLHDLEDGTARGYRRAAG